MARKREREHARWTREEIERAKHMRENGWALRQIARELHRTTQSVTMKMGRLGVKLNTHLFDFDPNVHTYLKWQDNKKRENTLPSEPDKAVNKVLVCTFCNEELRTTGVILYGEIICRDCMARLKFWLD